MFLDLASWTLGGVSGWAFSLFVVCSHFIRLIVSQINGENDEARELRGRRAARATKVCTAGARAGARAARVRVGEPERDAPGAGCTLLTGTLRGR